MTTSEQVDAVVKEVLTAFWDPNSQVDLFKILNSEGILLAPGNFGESFCGRIEYHSDIKRFMVFFPEKNGDISARTRFSLAHELGHYYLPHHNGLLLQGASHSSSSGFICENKMEREADEFASLLLIPDQYLLQKMQGRKFLTLSAIIEMANQMGASITAACVRYCKFTDEACAVILSQSGKLKFYLPSKMAVRVGFGSPKGIQIPIKSGTAALHQSGGSREVIGREGLASSWFPSTTRNRVPIWEEAFPLGYTQQVVTVLAFEDEPSS